MSSFSTSGQDECSSRGHCSASAPCPHHGPANISSGLCFPLFAECFVHLDAVLMLQPSDCSESQGEGANFNICLNSSFQTYTNWSGASLGICLLMQFANCGFRSALFSKYQLFVDGAKSGIARDWWGLWNSLSRHGGASREDKLLLGEDLHEYHR